MILDYTHFSHSKTAVNWQLIGDIRRAGVVAPLFSIYSRHSIGIGEIPDLYLLVRLCFKTGMSIMQLLPMNDVGFDFAPYNSLSSFALDPMYISISKLKDTNLNLFKKEINKLRSKFPAGTERVNYAIKKEKIELLWRIYRQSYTEGSRKFKKFSSLNFFWLNDYALYKVLKEKNGFRSWEEWSDEYKNRDEQALSEFIEKNKERINFHKWLQWQLYEQFRRVKKYAKNYGVFILGDLPFLVGRDSADVWSKRKYFDLNFSAGAPPDMYFATGQNWGMPPYNRLELEKDGYKYVTEKLKYAENFYHLYRIDHFIGFFRLWTIGKDTPVSRGGMDGAFNPREEHLWEYYGTKLIDAMLAGSLMLPCAEDLGTVPVCSGKVLWEYGIPGVNVQRWMKDANNGYNFVNPGHYRINSAATVSTHDSSTLMDWWHNEAGTIDEKLFERLCKTKNFDDGKYNYVKDSLFNTARSNQGRLHWKDEIDSVDKLLGVLELSWDGAGDIVQLYSESFGEKRKFLDYIGLDYKYQNKISVLFIKKVLEIINSSASIFSIQLIQEWLCLSESFFVKCEEKSYRINFPGIVNDSNWTLTMPVSLEYMLKMKEVKEIHEIVKTSGRV